MAPTPREPFTAIRNAPGRFVMGVAGIALATATLTALFFERDFGLWLGLTAGFQGAAYMWLLRFCHARAERPTY